MVLLVDVHGSILLQERDEHAPVAPNCWGMVGGQVEPGESPEAAAYRELAEETSLTLSGGLTLWRVETWKYPEARQASRYWLWAGHTAATDEEICVSEGRQIRFVEPAKIASLNLGGSAAHFVPHFVASEAYRSGSF